MFKTVQKFPARTKRNSTISAAIQTFEQESALKNCWVGGRVIGILEDGIVLQDDSGRLDIVGESFMGVS